MNERVNFPKTTCEKCGRSRLLRVPNPLRCPSCGHFPGTKIRNKKPKVDAPAGKHEASTRLQDYQ